MPYSTPSKLRGLPGVPNKFADYMKGEERSRGKVIEVRGWHGWSDRKKLKFLRKLAERYGDDPHMRWHTVNVLRQAGAQPRDYRAQAAALLAYAQSMYYTNEPGEQVQSPWRTMKEATGDCDDLSVLLASMAESIKLPWKYVLAGRGLGGKRIRYVEGGYMPWNASFSHIYVQLGWPPFSPTTWVSAEPTMRGAPLGYDVAMHGVQETADGQVSMPELAGWGLAPNGQPIAVQDTDGNITPISQGLQLRIPNELLKRLDWDAIIQGVVQGIIVALAVTLVVPFAARRIKNAGKTGARIMNPRRRRRRRRRRRS